MSYGLNTVEDPLVQWVTFVLHNETYGIEVLHVQEVLKINEITPVPGSPDFVLGVINLRGNVVTVVDIRKRFGLPPLKASESSRIIIIESGEQVVGILVDRVTEVVHLQVSEIERVPNMRSEDQARYIQGVSNTDEGLLILIDVDRLIANEDQQKITET